MLHTRAAQFHTVRLALIATLFFCLTFDAVAEDYVEGELLIYIESDHWPVSVTKDQDSNVVTSLTSLDSLNLAYDCQSMEKIYKGKAYSAQGYHILKFPISSDMDSIAAVYEDDTHVRFATPNYLIEVDMAPSDSLYPARPEDPGRYQWAHNMDHMMSEGAWDIERGDSTVLIQIIDTGIDWRHPDLVSNIWQNLAEDYDQDGQTIELVEGEWELDPGDLNEVDDDSNGYPDDLIGWDFSDTSTSIGDNNPEHDDSSGSHGTIVSGMVCAVTDNISGGAGTAWNCRIMPAKTGTGVQTALDQEAVVAAVFYGADNGARVINMSFGNRYKCDWIEPALSYADTAKDVVLVASAGNYLTEVSTHCPARLPYVLAVAAVDSMDVKCEYSNWADFVDVCAPGHNWAPYRYFDTLSNEFAYSYYFGETCWTSWCAPFASGQAALLRSYYPDSTNDQIMNLIKSTTDSIYHIPGNQQYEGKLGTGRINLYRPLALFVSGTIDTNTVWSGNIYVTGDVAVANTVTLTIEPGTAIRFKPGENIHLVIQGTMRAAGTEEDSILFTSAAAAPSDSDWYGITVGSSMQQSLLLRYCVIERASTGVILDMMGVGDTISHCRFFNNDVAAIKILRNAFVEHCVIHNDSVGGSNHIYGILCDRSSPTIEHTLVENCQYGIKTTSQTKFNPTVATIEECGFYNIQDAGIYVDSWSNPSITKCCFKGSFGKAGIEINGGSPSITKCSMASENDSIFIGLLFENGAKGRIRDVAIWGYDSCAVMIEGGTTNPNFGDADSAGNSGFAEPDLGQLYFASFSDATILARYNFWDRNDGDSSAVREGIVGDVVIDTILVCPPNAYWSSQCSDLPPSDYEFDPCQQQKLVANSEQERGPLPPSFSLSQNYPNPFNPQTVIQYSLPEAGHVRLAIYNILGQKVKTLVDEHQEAGSKTLFWDGTDSEEKEVASGIYFFWLQAGEFEAAKRMILMR